MWQSEAEKLFLSEIREKKKTASGVHHKTGKNGYVGNMRFPSDILSRKEKKIYKGTSKVTVSNMYQEILTIEEFEKLETYEQRNMLSYWRNTYSNKEITDKMGIWNARYYKIVADLELPKARRVNTAPRKATAKKVVKKEPAIQSAIQSSLVMFEENAPPEAPPAPVAAPPVVQEIIVEGLHLSFIGTYNAEKIQKQLSKFDLLLEGEEDDFYIEMKIMQKASKQNN